MKRMKRYFSIFSLLSFGIFLQSCFYGLDNSISGNGNVITETRTVKDFHGVSAAAGLKVYVTFGEMSNEVEIEADENLHEYIITEVERGILKIRARKGIRNAEARNIYVNAGRVDLLEVSSAAKLMGENLLITDDLRIGASSAGSIRLDLEAGKVDVNVSSSGDARLGGMAEDLDVNVSSAGGLNAFELEVKNCHVDVSSAGNARVFVTGELNANASSAGSVKYKGSPESKNISKSSAGSVSGN